MLRAIRAEKIGGQRHGLVEGVGVERLGAAEHRRQRLVGGPDHIVVGVLLGQRDPGGLTVGSQHERARVFRLEPLHEAGPEQPGCAQLRDFHEEVHADAEEEREARREIVDGEPARERRPHVVQPVGEGEA